MKILDTSLFILYILLFSSCCISDNYIYNGITMLISFTIFLYKAIILEVLKENDS